MYLSDRYALHDEVNIDTVIANIDKASVVIDAKPILREISAQVHAGALTAIMGPSGSGKTTLLRALTGQVRLASGELSLFGTPMHAARRRQWDAVRLRMGVLFQSGALLSDYSVFDNVAFALRQHTNLDAAQISDIVRMRLASVNMLAAQDKMPSELSGGMARRAALARALVMDPEVVFLDEPFAGQDPETLRSLMTLFRSSVDTLGVAAVLVSHDIEEALQIADYVYVLAEGRIVEQGPPQQIYDSGVPLVRAFLGEATDRDMASDVLQELL